MLQSWAVVTGGGMATAEGRDVPKAKGRPKRSERDDVTVKVDRTIVGRAKTLATYHGVSVAELISDALRAPLAKMWHEMVRESDREANG